MHTDMILVDIRKAFDTLDHGVLHEKTKYFGFRISVIKWFEYYWFEFFVCIDVFSQAGTLKYGVPQGSILDCSFFYYIKMIFLNLHANDTCIFYRHEDVKKIEKL